MDVLLACLIISVVALVVAVVMLVRKTHRMQARLERQSAAILLLASRHQDLEMPGEPERARPVLRLLQGGLGVVVALIAARIATVGRRPLAIAAGSVLVATGAVALVVTLPADRTSGRPATAALAPSRPMVGIPGTPAPTAPTTAPSAAASSVAPVVAPTSSISVQPVSYATPSTAPTMVLASPLPSLTPRSPQLPATTPSLSVVQPTPTPSASVSATPSLPVPAPTGTECLVALKVGKVLNVCVP